MKIHTSAKAEGTDSPTPMAAQMRRLRKSRGKARRAQGAIVIAALALCSGIIFGGFTTNTEAESDKETFTPTAEAAAPLVKCITTQAAQPTEPIAPELPALLSGIASLDIDTQRQIYEVCGEDDHLFCCVMAIADQETKYDTEAVGDGGRSIGLMQINTAWQQDRIERLGITDLTDPAQNVTVAIDYIAWLTDHLDLGETPYESHALYMAYNMGLKGSKDCGATQTEYSVAALDLYHAYLTEMEAEK